MCITQDGFPLSHEEQAARLCEAGARWIQLRMKNAEQEYWIKTACAVVEICREHGAVCIVNDSVDVAFASGADGVHLGKEDEDWRDARRRLGRGLLLGGTVNNEKDANRAVIANCLDYVGIGPWRFTTTKKNLAPVLGESGVRLLVAMLDGLPAWVIGGVEPADIPSVRATGAAGVAVSSGLYRGGMLATNFRDYAKAWADDGSCSI
ncbi:MAG: thiamine phosphate synthase [Nibricoccus sp.]